MRYLIPTLISSLVLLYSCNGTGSGGEAPCTTEPSPIFSDTMRVVAEHDFKADGQESTEEVVLSNQVRIEIFQSGCRGIRQEFRISRKGDFKEIPDPAWVMNMVQTLGGLSETSPALRPLEQYANLIAPMAKDIRLGQAFSPSPGLSVTLDKVVSNEAGTMVLVFGNEE